MNYCGDRMNEEQKAQIRAQFALDMRKAGARSPVAVRIHPDILREADELAEVLGVPRAQLIEQGLADINGQIRRALDRLSEANG